MDAVQLIGTQEIYNGRLEEKFPDIEASGAKIMRYGGSAVDKHYENEAEGSRPLIRLIRSGRILVSAISSVGIRNTLLPPDI